VYEPEAPLVVSEAAQKLTLHYEKMYLDLCVKYVNPKGRHCTRPKPNAACRTRWAIVFQRLLNEGYVWNDIAAILNGAGGNNRLVAGKLLAQGPQSRVLFPVKEAK
jgi:hypothetical protein